jgi:D-amino-acid dehydrogenase
MRVTVIGAGVNGVVTAWALARRGAEVTVVEREAGPADYASFANGGVVGGTQIEPWAAPGLRWLILKWLFREDAPLLVRWRQLPKITGWGLQFLQNCEPERFKRNLAASGRLTRHSLACFAALREAADIVPKDYSLIRKGALKLYHTAETMAAAAAEADLIRGLGFQVEAIDATACARLEPGLAPVATSLAGGLHFKEDEVGDCRAFTQLLAERARILGVTFHFAREVIGLVRQGDRIAVVETTTGPLEADAVVVATASRSAPLLLTAGLNVPVVPTKGLTISVPAAPWPDAVRGAVMDHSRLFGLIRIGDDMRVSGSAEIAGYDTTPSDRRCDAIIKNVLELFPAFQACLDAGRQRRWAGLRGNSPDGPPIIGPTSIRNLFLDIGHGPQGWSTSAGAADLVADCVMGSKPAIDLDGLTLARFGRG